MAKNNANDMAEWTSRDLIEAISKLYCSAEYQDLIGLSKEQTLMQMTGCERDENAHSSFLAKLFQTKPCSIGDSDSPILYFLRLLAYKANEQAVQENQDLSDLMDITLLKNILTNNCSVDVIKVKTESVTASDKIEGRADIVIDCQISSHSLSHPSIFRIVVENKIDSKEGRKIIDNSNGSITIIGQCNKYFNYYESIKDLMGIDGNIFVFLSPKSPYSLSDSHFIKITYTDLLYHVLKVVLKQRSAYDENMAEALAQYVKTISSPQNNPIIAMDNDYLELAKKFFRNNQELITRVVEAAASSVLNGEALDKLNGNLETAQSIQPDYLVTYQGTSYNESTKLNKLAYQAVWLLVNKGATKNIIEAIFANIRPKKGFLLTAYPSQNKGEKITINDTDYWVPTNIWAAQSTYVKNLFEVFSEIPDLSYEILN